MRYDQCGHLQFVDHVGHSESLTTPRHTEQGLVLLALADAPRYFSIARG